MSTIRSGTSLRPGERFSRGNFSSWDEGYRFHLNRAARLLDYVNDCERVEARARNSLESAYQGDQDDADFRKLVRSFDKAHQARLKALDAFWNEKSILKGIENGYIEP